jgi:hypothetical protein
MQGKVIVGAVFYMFAGRDQGRDQRCRPELSVSSEILCELTTLQETLQHP